MHFNCKVLKSQEHQLNLKTVMEAWTKIPNNDISHDLSIKQLPTLLQLEEFTDNSWKQNQRTPPTARYRCTRTPSRKHTTHTRLHAKCLVPRPSFCYVGQTWRASMPKRTTNHHNAQTKVRQEGVAKNSSCLCVGVGEQKLLLVISTLKVFMIWKMLTATAE